MAKIDTAVQSTKPKAKYVVKNWPEYNKGLTQRGSLTLWIDEETEGAWYDAREAKRGGQYVYSDDCIGTLLRLKVVFRLAFRQLEGFANSIFRLGGISLKVPCYTQICRREKGLPVSLGISDKVKKEEGIHIVIDSSGLKIYGECEWKVRKHGYSKRRTWRKIHLGVDEKSGEIVAQVLTDNKTDDASMVVDLVADTLEGGVGIGKASLDGAYDTFDCWDFLTEMQIDAIIPPRENAVYQLDKDGALTDHARNLALEIIDEGGTGQNLAGWKVQSGYHRRSISENAFFRWKTILGEKMYARKFENQVTEAAIKAAVLNRFIQIAKPVAVPVAA